MSSNTVDRRVGVAIFGLGRAGQIHARNLSRSPRVRLLWFVDADTEKARETADTLWIPDVTIITPNDAEKVFKDERSSNYNALLVSKLTAKSTANLFKHSGL